MLLYCRPLYPARQPPAPARQSVLRLLPLAPAPPPAPLPFLPAPQCSVLCVLHPCGLSDCLVTLIDVTVPFSPLSDSLPPVPCVPLCPTHTATCHPVPSSILTLQCTPSSQVKRRGCFYSPGRKENVLLICRDNALFCIVLYFLACTITGFSIQSGLFFEV